MTEAHKAGKDPGVHLAGSALSRKILIPAGARARIFAGNGFTCRDLFRRPHSLTAWSGGNAAGEPSRRHNAQLTNNQGMLDFSEIMTPDHDGKEDHLGPCTTCGISPAFAITPAPARATACVRGCGNCPSFSMAVRPKTTCRDAPGNSNGHIRHRPNHFRGRVSRSWVERKCAESSVMKGCGR